MTLPSGTITFLFTDIEGSTKRWETYPDAMREALARHDRLLQEAIEARNGHVFKTVGDAFCAAFSSPLEAVQAAIDIQCGLLKENWEAVDGLRVRMALHTGNAVERDGDYFGPTLNRVARLQSLASGQQTLLSQATVDGCHPNLPESLSLQDLGQHWLKDLQQPEHVWQLDHPDLPTMFPPLRSLRALPNNLPLQLTSFIGREEEIDTIKRLLTGDAHGGQPANRLVTLTGAGGIGKTRLALQAAADLAEQFPDGVWLVELASYTEEARMIEAIASVLGVREEAGKPLLATLIDHCKSRKLLILLDNCEQIVQSAALVTDRLLRFCPQVSLLTTSREALGIGGEYRYRVPSLGLPSPDRPLPIERLTDYGAVRLFVERAVAAKPDFALSAGNGMAVAQICRRLDGIPLATELAAARMRAMPVAMLASRLEENFQLLTGGSRAVLPRHQTLRALIDWSYDLLSGQERALFMRLSVFAGGWTLEMAEAICAGEGAETASERSPLEETLEEWEVLDLLTGLVDKSLVLYEEQELTGRYRLLEPLRQYGREQLKERGELLCWQVRHRDYFQKIVIAAKMKLQGGEQNYWLNYLTTESSNVRGALNCYAEADTKSTLEAADGALWLEMVCILVRYWYICGPVSEGREWLDRAISANPSAEGAQRVRAYNNAGALANLQGDRTTAREYYRKALEIATSEASPKERALTLNNLALVEEVDGNYERMADNLKESLEIYRALDSKQHIAITLINLGLATKNLSKLEEAKNIYLESLGILKNLNDRASIASVTEHLAELAIQQNDLPLARGFLRESVQIRKEQQNLSGLAFCLEWYGSIAVREGQYERALSYLGTAEAYRIAVGRKRSLSAVEIFENDRSSAWSHLGDVRAQMAWTAGQKRSIVEAIQEVETQ